MICFDWRFPEVSRILALGGSEVIAHPSNLVMPYCQEVMRARCIENRVFAVTANRVGTDARPDGARETFTGQSQVDPEGRVQARAVADGREVVEVDLAEARRKQVNAGTISWPTGARALRARSGAPEARLRGRPGRPGARSRAAPSKRTTSTPGGGVKRKSRSGSRDCADLLPREARPLAAPLLTTTQSRARSAGQAHEPPPPAELGRAERGGATGVVSPRAACARERVQLCEHADGCQRTASAASRSLGLEKGSAGPASRA
jgi:hypothetical protein